MQTVTTIAFVGLGLTALLCLARLFRGPSLADRIVALDLLLFVIVGSVAVAAVRSGSGAFLDVLVVAALLGFVSTVTVARFIEKRGA
ncbi:MAG: pH regulation protein F [Acidimicrobiia bacterium]|nr:pH regulation protein F [Acidimicrobiia bacterium]